MTGGRVVVLGPTGRNFAAGMSGGLAFIHDPEGVFPGRVNPTMSNQIEQLDQDDLIELHELLSEHRDRTGSTVAAAILDDWQQAVSDFVKVFPTDYKRVLAELEAETTREQAGALAGSDAGEGGA
jgi:glutamate synthase domain-containing protein 3